MTDAISVVPEGTPFCNLVLDILRKPDPKEWGRFTNTRSGKVLAPLLDCLFGVGAIPSNPTVRLSQFLEVFPDEIPLGLQEGHVYAILNKANGAIKIGYTTNVQSRMRQLSAPSASAGYPVDLELLGSVEGDRSHETAAHKRLSDTENNGEWFYISKKQAAATLRELEAKNQAGLRRTRAFVKWAMSIAKTGAPERFVGPEEAKMRLVLLRARRNLDLASAVDSKACVSYILKSVESSFPEYNLQRLHTLLAPNVEGRSGLYPACLE